MSTATAESTAGLVEDQEVSTAITTDAGESSSAKRDPVRDMVFAVARVADALMSDTGYTRKHAAQALVNIARQHRGDTWSDEDFAMIQGAARKLATVVNLPPLRTHHQRNGK